MDKMDKWKIGIQTVLVILLAVWCREVKAFFPKAKEIIDQQQQSIQSLVMMAFLVLLLYFILDICYVGRFASMVFSTIGMVEVLYVSTIIGQLTVEELNSPFTKALAIASAKTTDIIDTVATMLLGNAGWILYIWAALSMLYVALIRFTNEYEFCGMGFLGVSVGAITVNAIWYTVFGLCLVDGDGILLLWGIFGAINNIYMRLKYIPDKVQLFERPNGYAEKRDYIILGICGVVFLVSIIAGKIKSWSEVLQYMFDVEYTSLEEGIYLSANGESAILLLMTIFVSSIVAEIVVIVYKGNQNIVAKANTLILAFLADVWIVEGIAVSILGSYGENSLATTLLVNGEEPVWITALSDANDKYLTGGAHEVVFTLLLLVVLFLIYIAIMIMLCGISMLAYGLAYSLVVVFLSFFAYSFFGMEGNCGTVVGIIFTLCINVVIGVFMGHLVKVKDVLE